MSVALIASAADRRLLDERGGTRAMMWIMAVMLCLTVLSAALGLATLGAARLLDRQLAGRLTVQIAEPDANVRERDVAAAVAALRTERVVRRVAPVDRARLADLLRPWHGEDGADPDLPIPALIDVDLAPGAGDAGFDRIAARLYAAVPAARIDRHESWLAPVRGVMRLTTGLAGALVLAMASATAAVVMLAARAGLETHRATIEVLHMLGSTDVQVARLFQRRIALDTLIGGLIGAGAAFGVLVVIGWQLAALGSDLIAGLSLGTVDIALLVALPFAFALLATVAARMAALAALRKFL